MRDGLPPDDRTFIVMDEEGRTVLSFPFMDAISDCILEAMVKERKGTLPGLPGGPPLKH